MLIRVNHMDNQQLAALDVLCADCKLTDGNLIAVYRHLLELPRPIPSTLLYYDKQCLVGFLRAFFFHESRAEIALMVSPAYRGQGIATKMLRAIMPLLQANAVDTLIFSTPHGLPNQWLSARHLQYVGSEYQMQYHQKETLVVRKKHPIRRATLADIPTLCAMDKACFPKEQADMPRRLQALLTDPHCALFIITQQGVPVGKAHLFLEAHAARLTDIAVLPHAQGAGLGSALITHGIQHAIDENKTTIALDVETNNKHALAIYTRAGFAVTNAHDYWEISFEHMLTITETPKQEKP